MLLALSKFLPRVLHRRSDRSGNDAPEHLKQATCRVVLLDDSELSLDVKLSVKGCILLDRVFLNLNLVEKEYFGLRFLDSLHQPLWLDLTKTVNSQMPAGDPPLTFYFGVKFYAVDPCKLNEEITRYQFFLQVKRDIVQGRLPVSVEMAAQLSAYAVQSELGDFNELFHRAGYVSEFSFVPDQTLDFEDKVAELHKTLRGQVPAQAEYHYLDTVKWLDMYGVDLHPVTGDGNIDYFLGLTPSGIVVYKNRTKISNYFWPRVLKITYKNKLFLIKARDKNNEENTFTFESSSKQACKHLYRCCVDYHSFYRLTSASHSFQQSKAKLLSFGSKTSYGAKYGRSDSSSSSQRVEQKVVRRPSARKLQMRSSGSESCPEDLSRMPRPLSAVVLSQPVNKCQRRDGYSSGPESSRYSSAMPWEDGCNQRGLYTGRISPTSVRSDYFPRRIASGSESDSTVCARRRHRCRGHPSDTETEIESCHRRHRIFAGTESESDVGSHHSRHRHRHHRHHGQSAESVNDSDPRWHCCQPIIHGSQLHGNADSVGSMSSMSSAPDSRRHRRRSKSPGLRPPQELAQHFRKIEDPSELGISNETFQDIPYFRVEVLNQRFSPRTRHRIRQYRRQRSCGELHSRGQSAVPDGEAPPPYLGSHSCYPCDVSSTAARNLPPSGHPQRLECGLLQSPVAVQVRQAHTAPIVKTKEIMRSEEPLFTGERNTRDLCSSSMLHDIGRPSNEYEQIAYKAEPRRIEAVSRSTSGQPPPSCRALNVHMREDSGLDLDSPGGSSSSQAAESVRRSSLLDSQCFPPRSEQDQRRRHHSPAAGTPAPSFRTSPYVEQALCEEGQLGFGAAPMRWALQSRQSVPTDRSRSSHPGNASHHSAFMPYPEGVRHVPQRSHQGRGKGHITEL